MRKRDLGTVVSSCECMDFVEASHRDKVYPLMYCHMEVTEHLNLERLKSAISLSVQYVPEILCAYDYKRGYFINRGYTVEDIVIEKIPTNKIDTLRWALDKHPQLQVLIEHEQNGDYIIFSMSHILADGEGFLQYLYLLAALYNGRQLNNRIQNVRDIVPLLKGIHISSKTEQSKYNKYIKNAPLRSAEKGTELFCLTTQLSSKNLIAIHDKAKQTNSTLNDVFMAAYARVISRLQNVKNVVIPCPVNLRRFQKCPPAFSVANMTGIYRRVAVEITPEHSFTTTLQQIHLEMELHKLRFHCFAGIKPLNRSFHKTPRWILRKLIQATYKLLPVSYTNVGVIDSEKLYFNDCMIKKCFIAGTYRLPPDFQLTISTYKNICTLNCMMIGTVDCKEKGQYILDLVKQEMLEWIGNESVN